MAFADFMTAMFAMFLVLWLVNQSEEVRASISSYFKDPVAWSDKAGRSVLTGSGPRELAERDMRIENERLRSEQVRSAGERIAALLRANPNLRRLQDRVEIVMTPEGLRIELREDEETTFFEGGSIALTDDAIGLLGVIGGELAKLDSELVIEGHTDARPYRSSSDYSNWELSSDRANSARRVLVTAGVPVEKIAQVRGFADRKLLVPGDPLSSRNRRITITVPLHNEPSSLQRTVGVLRGGAAQGPEGSPGAPATAAPATSPPATSAPPPPSTEGASHGR